MASPSSLESEAVAATKATTTASKEHLKDFIGICSMETMASPSLIYFFDICSLIVLVSFSRIRKNFISFSNVLEHFISMFFAIFIIILMFIRMPPQRLLSICFLYFFISGALPHLKEFVVIFSFRFLKFQLRILYFLFQPLHTRINLLYSFKITNCLLVILIFHVNVRPLHIRLHIIFI